MRRLIWVFVCCCCFFFFCLFLLFFFFNQSSPMGEMILATAWENVRSDVCSQRRLRSACASTQSDQRLHSSHEETLHSWPSKMRPVKIQFRPCEPTGWSESSLGAQVRRLSDVTVDMKTEDDLMVWWWYPLIISIIISSSSSCCCCCCFSWTVLFRNRVVCNVL